MGNSRPYQVLVLCTGNSARSILAEAILNHRAQGRFVAHSAGSHPAGRVNPHALRLLREKGIDTLGLRSKSWDEFASTSAPRLDFIVTVCDNAAGETCPFWPSQPVTTHWGLPDPAAVAGTDEEQARAFSEVFATLDYRVAQLLDLTLDSMDATTLKRHLDEIGRTSPPCRHSNAT